MHICIFGIFLQVLSLRSCKSLLNRLIAGSTTLRPAASRMSCRRRYEEIWDSKWCVLLTLRQKKARSTSQVCTRADHLGLDNKNGKIWALLWLHHAHLDGSSLTPPTVILLLWHSMQRISIASPCPSDSPRKGHKVFSMTTSSLVKNTSIYFLLHTIQLWTTFKHAGHKSLNAKQCSTGKNEHK